MAFTCPKCGMVTHHPDDEKFGYCGNCHGFTGASGGRMWAGLVNVEVVSGTAEDHDKGGKSFRGFVTVRAVAEDGSIMAGQLDPDDVREMAMNFLSVAEAADQDALVFQVLVNRVKVPAEVAANVVMDMRKARGHKA